jgi:hypothetical protein
MHYQALGKSAINHRPDTLISNLLKVYEFKFMFTLNVGNPRSNTLNYKYISLAGARVCKLIRLFEITISESNYVEVLKNELSRYNFYIFRNAC